MIKLILFGCLVGVIRGQDSLDSLLPSQQPSQPPRYSPSRKPSKFPTILPTTIPTIVPTSSTPMYEPSVSPSNEVSFIPTYEGTDEPTPTAELPPKAPPCLCMFASSCIQDSDCCPGLFCQINSGWTMCMEPSYNTSLCIQSQFGYGCQTSADCCNPNAACEKLVCKLFCGTSPTRSPSVFKPTKKPSVAPSISPTNVPNSLKPTALPSAVRTRTPTTIMPTEIPTLEPSFVPSEEPTMPPITPNPTRKPSMGRPTRSPTLKPATSIPTPPPSFQTFPIVRFESFIVFQNVSSVTGASFGENNRKDILTTVDTVLGVAVGSTVYIGDSIYQPTSSRHLITNVSGHSIAIIAHVFTTLSTQGYPQYTADPTALIEKLTHELSISVSSGSFFSLLMSETAFPMQWSNIYVIDVTFINNQIVFPPTAAPTEYKYASKREPQLGTTMMTLVVCAIFVCVVFIGVLVYKLTNFFSAKHKAARESEIFILNAKSMSENRPDKNFTMVGTNFTEVHTDTANYDCDLTDINLGSTSSEGKQ